MYVCVYIYMCVRMYTSSVARVCGFSESVWIERGFSEGWGCGNLIAAGGLA